MRCIALAQACQDQGGDVTFLTHCDSEALRQRIIKEGFNLIPVEKPHPDPSDLEETLKCLSAIRSPQSAICNWVVLDGYHFTSDYQKAIKESGHRLLVIDDMAHLDHYYGDIILNQNIHAEELQYSCEPTTKLLLGTKYVLLRKEFWPWLSWKRPIPKKVRRILVTMGGADPDNVTLKCIEAIKNLNEPDVEVKVIVGPANPNKDVLVEAMASAQCSMSCLENATNMPELMAWADMAISSAGSTCWELLLMQLPAAVIILAENQKAIAEKLHRLGLALNVGWHEKSSSKMIMENVQRMSHDQAFGSDLISRCQRTIDGLGPERLLREL